MPSGNVYSSVELKIRDKAIEEKHQLEVRNLEAKARRIRVIYDSQAQTHFEYVNQAEATARLLGFRSLGEVKAFIEIADEPIPYKQLLDRVDELKHEISMSKRDNEILNTQLTEARDNAELLKATLAQNESNSRVPESSAQALAQELVELRARYNAQADVARRADEYYRAEFKKWREYKHAMHEKEIERQNRRKELRRKQKHHGSLQRSKQKTNEPGLDLEVNSPIIQNRRQKPDEFHLSGPAFPSSSPTIVASTSTTPAMHQPVTESPSPIVLSSTRIPLQFEPIAMSKLTQFSSHRSSAPKANDIIVIDSSDTEDSQGRMAAAVVLWHKATYSPLSHTRGEKRMVNADNFNLSSCVLSLHPVIQTRQTELPSRTANKPKLPAPHPTLPVRPAFPQFYDLFLNATGSRRARRDSFEGDEERPQKIQRLDTSPTRTPFARIHTTGVRSPPNRRESTRRPDDRRASGRENRIIPSGPTRKERDGGTAPTSTPANTNSNKPLTDYSAFKGRGRYGKTRSGSGDTTINAAYTIDPTQNGGMGFQYDEVVRGKEDRRRMEGGDCECCRDYYEAIGPLPSRLQPPLWRSPPNSPERDRPCRHNDAEAGQHRDIASHKQAISRHRHHWARASTPPGYWNIGFPTTQETDDINEKAKSMHQQKKRDVQAEAVKGGRYKPK
ncbi:DNA repair protein endonuclease SAE2/CtIP C-terminus-domain-containing protein [Mycena rebaudengoi]|nr:DNA repair protein endonuclease SAE2/CtIP C-terminus-domain-containing protein [Mycena rebaudengoi]